MSGSPPERAAAGDGRAADGPLDRMIGILWPVSERLRTVTDGAPPEGFRVARSYLAIPGFASARFLVPAASPRIASASLLRYNALRDHRTRLVRGAVGASLRLGAAGTVFRDRLDVCVPRDLPASQLPDVLLEEWLREAAFDGRPLHVAAGVGRQGPNHKPVLQIFSPAAAPIGYAKVGWNDYTRELVRTEAGMLARCATAAMSRIWTPSPLLLGGWLDLEVGVASPLPGDAHRYRQPDEPPIETALRIAALAGSPETAAFAGGAYESRLRAALELAPRHVAEPARRLLERVRSDDPRLAFGSWHGDFVPWNLATVQGGLAVWDWEHGGDGVPVGFDLVHWHFQVGFVGLRLSAAAAAARARELARPGLIDLGVEPERADAVVSLYLVELLARFERAAAAGAGRSPRVDPALADVIAGLAERG